jgi:hypothetical protein
MSDNVNFAKDLILGTLSAEQAGSLLSEMYLQFAVKEISEKEVREAVKQLEDEKKIIVLVPSNPELYWQTIVYPK